MSTRREKVTNIMVQCEVCLAEIPSSSAKNEEASDYVRYFCGLNCYDKWKNRDTLTVKKTESESDDNQP